MKNLMKTSTALIATILLLASCGSTANLDTKQIGTVGTKAVSLKYFSELYPDEVTTENEEESTTETLEENTLEQSDVNAEEEVTFAPDQAVLVSVMSEVLKQNGQKYQKQDLNRVLSNLKVQNGDDYIKEAEKTYSLPMKSQNDVLDVLRFSLLYTDYLKSKAPVTTEEISEEYYKSHQKKYCASHILVDKKADADKIQKGINDDSKNFEFYETEGQKIMDAEAAANGQTPTGEEQLMVNEAKINGVTIKQLSDLGCQPSSTYVEDFKKALEAMEEKTVTSKPVKTEHGYHIIKLREIETNELTGELQEEIENTLVSQKQQTPGFQGYYLLKALDKVEFEITHEASKEAFDTYLDSLKTDRENFEGVDGLDIDGDKVEDFMKEIETEESSTNVEETKNVKEDKKEKKDEEESSKNNDKKN